MLSLSGVGCAPVNGKQSGSPPDHSSSGSSPEQGEVKFESQKSVDSDSKVSPTQVCCAVNLEIWCVTIF